MKKSDFFIPILLLAIILGKVFPEPALYDGVVNLKIISDIGIALVFLFYGIKLNLKQLKADIANWKLHLVIQFSTFVLFPLLVLPFTLIFREHDTWLLWLGGFFLASLPSTVSSSVILVSIAKGNVSSAIFNASISSLAGIFITPLWIGLIITGQEANASEQWSIILKLIMQVFLPVMTGLFLNRYLGKIAEECTRFINTFDRAVIILIIYLSFSKSFYTNQFNLVKVTDLFLTFLFCLILLFII
jgi:sodium/bile acid cotransporter 7